MGLRTKVHADHAGLSVPPLVPRTLTREPQELSSPSLSSSSLTATPSLMVAPVDGISGLGTTLRLRPRSLNLSIHTLLDRQLAILPSLLVVLSPQPHTLDSPQDPLLSTKLVSNRVLLLLLLLLAALQKRCPHWYCLRYPDQPRRRHCRLGYRERCRLLDRQNLLGRKLGR